MCSELSPVFRAYLSDVLPVVLRDLPLVRPRLHQTQEHAASRALAGTVVGLHAAYHTTHRGRRRLTAVPRSPSPDRDAVCGSSCQVALHTPADASYAKQTQAQPDRTRTPSRRTALSSCTILGSWVAASATAVTSACRRVPPPAARRRAGQETPAARLAGVAGGVARLRKGALCAMKATALVWPTWLRRPLRLGNEDVNLLG